MSDSNEKVDCIGGTKIEKIEQMISDLLAGALDSQSQDNLCEHLEQCEKCKARATAMFRQDRALIELGAEGGLKDLRQRIHAKLAQSNSTPQKAVSRKLRTVRLRRPSRSIRSIRAGRAGSSWLTAAALVALAITLFVCYKYIEHDDHAAPEIARLSILEGSSAISVVRDGKSQTVATNMALKTGDSISVPEGAKVSVHYVDQETQLDAGPNAAAFRLAAPEDGKRVALDSGSLSAEVAHQTPGTMFVITTPLVRAEVIGTHFQLATDTTQTRLDVSRGKVRLVRPSDGAKVEVEADQFAVARQSGPLLAEALNAPPKSEHFKRIVSAAEENELKARAAGLKPQVLEALQKFSAQTFRSAKGPISYRLFTPEPIAAGQKYPLVVFLHGIGGDGKDNLKQLNDQPFGPGIWALKENQAKHPCFVVAPQSQGSWDGTIRAIALEMVDDLLKTLPIDRQHVYVTGVSSGGNGVYGFLQDRPKLFAAGIPMSGWISDIKTAKSFAHIPIWIFHGNNDQTVKVGGSRVAFDALSAAGADVRYFEVDGSAHDIFSASYCTDDLMEWTFARGTR